MSEKIKINVNSEIGKLEGVIIHTPGLEVENMTPENAERALYSDILNLSVAKEEYTQLHNVLDLFTKTFQVKDLLSDVLSNTDVKKQLIHDLCQSDNAIDICDQLNELNPTALANQIIVGVPTQMNSLTNYISNERYTLRPLHNFFFTRDASFCIHDKVMISKMANKVREKEAIIMKAIFSHSSKIQSKMISMPPDTQNATIEGGDVLIVRDDIIVIGMGKRTSSQGIDFIANQFLNQTKKQYIVVQELPSHPESFIHLDMVFTILDKDCCMVYEPIIMQANSFRTLLMQVENGKITSIKKQSNIVNCLKNLGLDLKPLYCGGKTNIRIQEREQWHSGANFFALAPGKLIGYARNVYTMEELNNNGFEIINAKDLINKRIPTDLYSKYVITIEGSELARGGGGTRCMTMPIRRLPMK